MIQDLNLNKIAEQLWCGTVTNFKHDMLEHSIQFKVNVNESGTETTYIVNCFKIKEIKIYYDNPENEWDYTELTEIVIEKDEDTFTVECDFWSAGGMKIICKNFVVNEI